MEKHRADSSCSPKKSVLVNDEYRVLAGRAGVVAAIFVFIAGYLYGLLTYGPVLGIGLGWLPCAAAAWLTAIVVASVVSHAAPRLVATGRQLTSFARVLAFSIQHRN